MTMLIESAAAPPFLKNGFVVGCERTREAVYIDPGDEVQELLATSRASGCGHAHPAHPRPRRSRVGRGRGQARAGRADLAAPRRPVPVRRTPCSRARCSATPRAAAAGGPLLRRPGADRLRRLRRASCITRRGTARAACACRSAAAARAGMDLFVGDTLFAGSIGRTDLPGGDYETLMRSITDVLLPLGDDARVHRATGRTRRSATSGGPTRSCWSGRRRRRGRDAAAGEQPARRLLRPGATANSIRPTRERVAAGQQSACVTRLAVHERAVGAVEVLDQHAVVLQGEPAVEARDQRRVEDEVGARGAAHRLDGAGQQPEHEGVGASGVDSSIHMGRPARGPAAVRRAA